MTELWCGRRIFQLPEHPCSWKAEREPGGTKVKVAGGQVRPDSSSPVAWEDLSLGPTGGAGDDAERAREMAVRLHAMQENTDISQSMRCVPRRTRKGTHARKDLHKRPGQWLQQSDVLS